MLIAQAAMADGRPYTAERRISALLEKGGAVDPKLIYQAAVVAGQLGKTSLRRERLLFFLRQEKGWNADVEAALLALCLDSGDADHYVRYLSSAPATEANLDLGLRMLAQMRTSKRISDYTKQLNILLSKYTSPAQRNRILVDASAMVNENVAGLQTAIFEVLARYPLHTIRSSHAARRWAAQTIDHRSRNAMSTLYTGLRAHTPVRHHQLPAERKERARRVQLESLCLPATASTTCAFFETIIRAPDVFLGEAAAPHSPAGDALRHAVRNDWNRVDKFRALGLSASAARSERGECRNHAEDYPNALRRGAGRLTLRTGAQDPVIADPRALQGHGHRAISAGWRWDTSPSWATAASSRRRHRARPEPSHGL